jgi:hypothetical protein
MCDMYVVGVQDLYPNYIPVAQARLVAKDENLVVRKYSVFPDMYNIV